MNIFKVIASFLCSNPSLLPHYLQNKIKPYRSPQTLSLTRWWLIEQTVVSPLQTAPYLGDVSSLGDRSIRQRLS